MYFHPLQEEIGNMPEEALGKRIRELSKKIAQSKRWIRNPEMLAQTLSQYPLLVDISMSSSHPTVAPLC